MYLAINRPRVRELVPSFSLFASWWIITSLSCMAVVGVNLFQSDFGTGYAAMFILLYVIALGLYRELAPEKLEARSVRWVYAGLCLLNTIGIIPLAFA